MLADQLDYVVGVDPHRDTHALAIVDVRTGGVVLGTGVAASSSGYAHALELAKAHAPGRRAFAIEGAGSGTLFHCRRPDYPITRTTRSRAARGSLMPTGIAAHYAASATPTSEPNSRPRKAGVSASATSQEITPFRSWCVTGALTEGRRVPSVKRVALPPKRDSLFETTRESELLLGRGCREFAPRSGRRATLNRGRLTGRASDVRPALVRAPVDEGRSGGSCR
jgi:hypothetical protein